MIRNLALLGFVIVLGFVAYSVISNLSGGIDFKFLNWSPFKLETPLPVPPPPVEKTTKKSSVSEITEKPKIVAPVNFEPGDLSPYYRKIRLDSVVAGNGPGERGQFVLRADHDLKEGIDVTSWKIKGNKGWETFITRAIADYNPLALPAESDIILYPGDYLNVYSWANSAFGSRNLRLNKCIGYINAVYVFDPELPKNCPGRSDPAVINFSGRCQSFIRSLESCEIPNSNELNSFSSASDAQCHDYLTRLNYRYCYDGNRNKADFFSHEWRAWLNQFFNFDREHDRLLLFDKSGKLVNEYVY